MERVQLVSLPLVVDHPRRKLSFSLVRGLPFLHLIEILEVEEEDRRLRSLTFSMVDVHLQWMIASLMEKEHYLQPS